MGWITGVALKRKIYKAGRSVRKGRRRRRPLARKAVDRRQNRNISKLYKMVKYGKERKYIDQSASGVPIDSTWLPLLPRDLTFILQGDNQGERVANKIKIHSHRLKIKVTYGDPTNIFRIMVVRFPNQAASLVTLGDALQDVSAASPLNLMSNLKREGDTKYQILWDSGVQRINDALLKQRSFDITLKGKGTGYYAGYNSSSAGGCIAGYTYVVACSDSAIAPNPSFTTVARTVFSG